MSCQRGPVVAGAPRLTGLAGQAGTRRWHRVLVLSALTGAVTGLAITGFDWLTARTMLEWVYGLPRLAQVFAPAVGLLLAFAALRWLGGDETPSTSDEYLRAYHDPEHPLDAPVLPCSAAGIDRHAGLWRRDGLRRALDLHRGENRRMIERSFGRFLTRDDLRLLLVAGAAAGVAAIFKAPATGAIFAIEVPFQEDTAAHALLPLLVGAASSYLVYVAFYGTTPLFEAAGQPHLDTTRLVGALGVGLLAGLGARCFALALRTAKTHSRRLSPQARIAVGGLGSPPSRDQLRSLRQGADPRTRVSRHCLDTGPQSRSWPHRRAVHPSCARDRTHGRRRRRRRAVHSPRRPRLDPGTLRSRRRRHAHEPLPGHRRRRVLGAGYRTPIAGIVFVAETTGRPGFVVPALIATAIAQVLMGNASVTTYQPVRQETTEDTGKSLARRAR